MLNTFARNLSANDIHALVGDAPVIVEAGCHDGTDTEQFLDAMPVARVFCFEPDSRPAARFKQRFSDDRRVTFYQQAVSDCDGYKPFFASTGKAGHMDDWDYSGSLCRPTNHLTRSPEISFKEPKGVSCVKLDTWHNCNPHIRMVDFCWADLQGHQRAFIAGARLTLAVTKYLYIEAHHRPLYEGELTQDELIALLPGFTPIGIYALDNILFVNKHRLK